jgi:hypothetical protein
MYPLPGFGERLTIIEGPGHRQLSHLFDRREKSDGIFFELGSILTLVAGAHASVKVLLCNFVVEFSDLVPSHDQAAWHTLKPPIFI